MCGRSSLTKVEKELEQRFNATFYSEDLERYNPLPNFNVAPTAMHPVLLNQDQQHLRFFRWGLIPFWAKDIKIGYRMINARSETLLEKPAFKTALRKRRCIVPFDGYYEWIKRGNQKIPFRIKTKDQEVFTIAGLWETWKSPSEEIIQSFTLITRPAVESIAHIHDRMPVLLPGDLERHWIDESIDLAEAMKLLETPYPDDQLEYYEVSTKVNNVRNNAPELVLPV